MKILVPMAGMGKRLRPHTLNTPKPLFPIAGKPIVQRLVEDIVAICENKVEEIIYIIGDFDQSIQDNLNEIAENLGAKCSIYKQNEALGTAHALWCCESKLEGEVIVAFADTLFKADFHLDNTKDGVIWVKSVEDPTAFGVVTLDENGNIINFVEKPTEFVSDLAIIGIYYFSKAENLKVEIQHLIENNIMTKGEYQLTDALESMKLKGAKFGAGEVKEWMDCGNKDAVIDTNSRILKYIPDYQLVSKEANLINCKIIPPCFIGDDVFIENSVVGPFVSVGNNSTIKNSVIKNSILKNDSFVENIVLNHSIVGQSSIVQKNPISINLGDYSAG